MYSKHRKIQEIVILYDACVGQSFEIVAENVLISARQPLPKEIISLISEYFVGPIKILADMISALGEGRPVFDGHYPRQMEQDRCVLVPTLQNEFRHFYCVRATP